MGAAATMKIRTEDGERHQIDGKMDYWDDQSHILPFIADTLKDQRFEVKFDEGYSIKVSKPYDGTGKLSPKDLKRARFSNGVSNQSRTGNVDVEVIGQWKKAKRQIKYESKGIWACQAEETLTIDPRNEYNEHNIRGKHIEYSLSLTLNECKRKQ